MTDLSTFDDEDEVEDEPETAEETAKGLRRAANEGKKAKAEAASLKREIAMLKAGVDTDSAIGKMFAKAYDGDVDPAAVKAAWAEVAPATATASTEPADFSTPDPTISDDEAASTAQRQALAANSPADQAPTPDPRDAALDAGLAFVKKGGTTEDSLGVIFESLVGAAMDGDKRVILNARD